MAGTASHCSAHQTLQSQLLTTSTCDKPVSLPLSAYFTISLHPLSYFNQFQLNPCCIGHLDMLHCYHSLVTEGVAYQSKKDRHMGLTMSNQTPYPVQPKLMDRAVFPPTSLLPALGIDPILTVGFNPGRRLCLGDKAA